MSSALDLALGELTPFQLAATNWTDGSLLVLAGPGSGKTRVLTTRIAKLLSDTPNGSFRVLALTFTNKAADEMSSRVTSLVPDQERRALIGTFHSFCMQMLQQHGSHIGIKPDFAIYSLDADRQDLLKDAIKAENLSVDDVRFLSTIDKLKAELIVPEGSARRFIDNAVGSRVEAVYGAYERALSRANAQDFNSLITSAYRLICHAPGVALHYRRTYKHWMFDEFQDTTRGQYQLIKTLAGESFANICAVADDDQIIYQWNGASYKQIQSYRADFQPNEIQLPTNYRCPPAIVAAANRLVVYNTQRTSTKKPLEAGKTQLRYPNDTHINIRRYRTDNDEVVAIATGISSIGSAGWAGVAVLARTRSLLDKIAEALKVEGVPAVIAQRRDDFRSPQFMWLASTLRQASRPLDVRALETLVGAFNRWFGTDTRTDLIVAAAELSSKPYLVEWALTFTDTNNPAISILTNATQTLAYAPGNFREFVDTTLSCFPSDIEQFSDVSEDKSAWTELTRSIGRTVGRDAPLEQFLQELAIRSKEPTAPAQSVTLMTIHGAKGKEFDHVYVAGLAEELLPSFYSLKSGENSAEMEEERRNCFVAITRAREWLCLSFADSYKGWAKKPSRFLTEMELPIPASSTEV